MGVAAAAVVLGGGALTLNHDLVGVFYDDGLYAGLAWALAHGGGYVHPNLPGAPAAVHYPPLYPLVLAPLFGTLSVSAAAFAGKVLNVILAAVACGLTAWHAARAKLLDETSPWAGAALVAAAGLAVPVLTVLTVLLSEPLFALLLVVAVILADRPPGRLSPAWAAALAGVAAALALLVRSIGVAVGAGVVGSVYLAARPQGRAVSLRHAALAAAPVLVAGIGWGGWVLVHRAGIDPLLALDYGSYFEVLRAAGPGFVGRTLPDLGRPLGVLTLDWVPGRAFYYLAGVPALAVGSYGLARWLRRSSIGLVLVIYLAILACWPIAPDRFLWPVLPWLALAWASGAAGLWRLARLRAPVALLALLLAWGYVRYEVRGFAGRWWQIPAQRVSDRFRDLLPVLDSLPPEAVIATDQDPLVWLYSRRRTVPRDVYGPPPAVYRAYLTHQGVTHVLVASDQPEAWRDVERVQAAFPGWLTPIRQWPGRRVLLAIRRER